MATKLETWGPVLKFVYKKFIRPKLEVSVLNSENKLDDKMLNILDTIVDTDYKTSSTEVKRQVSLYTNDK